ncbi:MAG: DMT family transporter [Xanthomonadales bacterium]|jgi:transporter family-2 protein|nr:DMT family transporter [Xanthomonadales bacterium]
MNYSLAIALAVIGGMLLPIQFLINARLSDGFNSALWATTISFVVGTIGLLAFIALRGQLGAANWQGALALPWWAWVGGLMGAVYVSLTIVTVPVVGPTALVVLLILGQMVAGTALDHFGVLTTPDPISLSKLLGLALVFAGTWLVVRA